MSPYPWDSQSDFWESPGWWHQPPRNYLLFTRCHREAFPYVNGITNGLIKDNILLGFESEDVCYEEIEEILRIAHLDEFVSCLPNNSNSHMGEGATQ
jgi:hypothetical protein